MDGDTQDDNIIHKGPPRRDIIWLLSQLTYHIIRIALRHQILVPEIEQLVRWQAAVLALEHKEFSVTRAGKNTTTASHAAVVTGLTRRDISEINGQKSPPIDADGDQLHRLIRILAAWTTEPEYLDANGHPIDLRLTGRTPSLHALNHRFGRNVPDRAIADWLVKHGNAEWIEKPEPRNSRKMLRWKDPVLMPTAFSTHSIRILGQHGYDFLHSIQEIINRKVHDRPRFRQIYFTDIPRERAEEAHRELKALVHEMTDRHREVLSRYRDPHCKDPVRIGVGSYTFKCVDLLEIPEEESP